MKRTILLYILLSLSAIGVQAQNALKLGAGYYGETLVYGGALVELEIEQIHSEKISLPLRINLGFYNQPRRHTGIFLDANYGFRQTFRSGIYLEESIGIGILQTLLNAEGGIFEVDEAGNAKEASAFNPLDLMPSLTLGLGYAPPSSRFSVWLRPKLYWQMPEKMTAVYHLAVQAGVSWRISAD